MEDFTIKTRLTTKEYAKMMFAGLYRKPVFVFAALLGLYLVLTSLLDFSDVAKFYSNQPFFELVCGIFLLIAPTLIVFISIRQLKSNSALQGEITYSFGEHGFTVKGSTFMNECPWLHIQKQKELGKFLILYSNKKFGHLIDKTALTPDQLTFIKQRVEKK